jgi:hypothetical protein
MRIERASLHKFAACLTVLGFLLGVTAAGAAQRDERGLKDPKPVQNHSLSTGQYKGLPSFLRTLGVSHCSSSCCQATANCEGANTSCSEIRCDAWCSDGTRSAYICPVATPTPGDPVTPAGG